MLHDFNLAGNRVRLWQRTGESYEHILMKALGFAMFAADYTNLVIELDLELRYKPDLIAVGDDGGFRFWGECGQNSIRKTHWILKHTRTERFVLFKIGFNPDSLIKQLRGSIPAKYRPENRFLLINFVSDIVKLTESKQIAKVENDWFESYKV